MNISRDPTKAGVNTEEALSLARAIHKLPRLKLRGLMTLPAQADDIEQQRMPFHALRTLFESIQLQGIELDTLSMGMSGDMEAAIAEGATMVRIGTAIFGPRQSKK